MREDGGPAFPSGDYVDGHTEGGDPVRMAIREGMSLRDWFAGQALAGLLAEQAHPMATGVTPDEHNEIAEAAYELADAMLAARAPQGREEAVGG